jgi:hypothetical protein
MYSGTDSLVALSDSSYDTDLATLSDSEPEYDPEDEILDDDGDVITPFSYDVDDPCINVGTMFIDVKQCKKAVIQRAILNDHVIRSIKIDKDRFRAVCLRADRAASGNFLLLLARENILGAR